MSLHDRDWYQDELARRRGAPRRALPVRLSWTHAARTLWIVVVILVVVAVIFQGSKRFLASRGDRPAAIAPEQSARPAAGPAEPAMAAQQEQRAPVPAAPAMAPEPPPRTRQVYLCKSYAGGMFWSSAVCSEQRATMDRVYTVPGQYSWPEQVAYAQRELNAVLHLYAPPQPGAMTAGSLGPSSSSANSAECVVLDAEVLRIDAMSRQPRSGWAQDQLRQERQTARSRQHELRCN